MKKITPELINKATAILKKNKIKNYALLNLIENNYISEIEIYKNCVAIKQNRSKGWIHLSCPNDENIETMSKLLKNERHFAATETKFINILSGGRKLLWHEDCNRLAYLKKEKFDIPLLPSLKSEHAKTVNEYWPYKSDYSLRYVKRRIKEGISSGKFIQNKLISWAITQDDSAMGFFHTLKEYRRNGFGEHVTKSLINKLIDKQIIPFVYIVLNNERSYSLTQKLGFELTGKVSWFEFE